MMVARSARYLAFMAALAFVAPAVAQEVAPSHLKAAHAAVSAIRATDQFDAILPQAAAALKDQLIQKNPDMQQAIMSTVDEATLAMVSRRADLEKEAALAYANAFSEEELNSIASFYGSEAGKKLLENGPIVTRKVLEAADIWQRGVARDLAQAVGEKLNALMAANAPAPQDGAPATDGAATDGTATDGQAN